MNGLTITVKESGWLQVGHRHPTDAAAQEILLASKLGISVCTHLTRFFRFVSSRIGEGAQKSRGLKRVGKVMRYIDSGARDPGQAVASWLGEVLTPDVCALSFQTGFFSADGLVPFRETLERLRDEDLPIVAAVGSNRGATLGEDIEVLSNMIGVPRDRAKLGVVSFSGGLFHPKTYHLRRVDGSQAAYVGSANLTPQGIGALHVEAGIIQDTAEGDAPNILNEIENGVRHWFEDGAEGVEVITGVDDIARIVEEGTLSAKPPPRGPVVAPAETGPKGPVKPSLTPLIVFPGVRLPATSDDSEADEVPIVPAVDTDAAAPAVAHAEAAEEADRLALIAEIPKAGSRWKQANFDLNTFRKFFQVEPGSHESVSLTHVNSLGVPGDLEHRPCVAVRSQNYRFELDAASGIPYPNDGRPIGVFLRTDHRTFFYHLLLPTSDGFDQVEKFLRANYEGRADRVKRIVVNAERLRNAWPECPIWNVT